jgi:Zn finger protein HypA/HybF involved in hydrogenase expression
MASDDETLHCEQCETSIRRDAATRTETYGNLDPEKWQTLCCPTCGHRLKTIFVGREE